MIAAVYPTQRTQAVEPAIVQAPPVKVAKVTVVGAQPSPPVRALRALYASVEAVRAAHVAAGLDFEIGPLRARFPEAQAGSPWTWHWVLAVSVPDNTISVPQLDPDLRVEIEVWVYDRVAELVHEGTEETKPASVQRLLEFVLAKGFRPAGVREEIYLGTGPAGGRTLLRYQILAASRGLQRRAL